MLKILILANYSMGLYKFRKELIQELLNQSYEVYISLPEDNEYIPLLTKMGCNFIQTKLDRRGVNPIKDFILIMEYKKLINKIKPNIVLSYTIKPNVYGGIICRITNTPFIANVTGLGTSIENESLLQKISLVLYKLGLKYASCVFFQNKSNEKFFVSKKIVSGRSKIIPGSGVNIEYHCFEDYPENDGNIIFLFIGRIMKDKGIDELLEAATRVKKQYPQVKFDIIGSCEEHYLNKLAVYGKQGIIKYYGIKNDVHEFIKNAHAIILPSYHEGMANVLLEAASSGRPVLASKVPGCIETFDEGISGFGFEAKNVDDLIDKLIKFIKLPYKKRKEMGFAGRRKMEIEFDRNGVINSYIEEIDRVLNKNLETVITY